MAARGSGGGRWAPKTSRRSWAGGPGFELIGSSGGRRPRDGPYPLHTGTLEGNTKIKVMKRMAYGFRDDASSFLKIRAAFPGVG